MAKDTTSTSAGTSSTAASDETPHVMTVVGPLATGSDLGHVLMNEHLVCEPTKKKRGRAVSNSNNGNNNLRMSLEHLSTVRSQPLNCVDNMTLYSEHEVMSELQHLKSTLTSSTSLVAAGASPVMTILDVTNAADGRDLKASVSIARRLGIQVIVGTSCGATDVADAPVTNENVRQEKEEEDPMERDIAHMEQELLHGISTTLNGEAPVAATGGADTNTKDAIRAGFIGEVILSEEFPLSEQQELRACAIVQGSTKAPLLVSAPASCIPQVLDQIEASGGSLRQTVFTQMDLYSKNKNDNRKNGVALLTNVLDRGAVICLDRFSVSAACFDFDGNFPTMKDVVHIISDLLQINPEYVHQIVLSSGIFMRLQYRKYGGPGYSVLQEELLPRLLSTGITTDQIHTMTRDNPRRLLEWWTPPPPPVKPIEYLTCSVCHRLFEPVLGEYFTKYTFTYCGRDCLKAHLKMKFKPIQAPPKATGGT